MPLAEDRPAAQGVGQSGARGGADGVTLTGMDQIKRLISDIDIEEQIDPERVARAAEMLVDGRSEVPAEDVADAILDEVVFLEALLR